MRCKWILLAVLLGISVTASAQADVHDWSNVKNVAPGSDLWIQGTHGNLSGAFQSADDGELRILQWRRRPLVGGSYSRRYRIPRDQVRQVRFAKRGLSALAGTAIGVAAGAGIGAAVDAPYRNHEARGIVMVVLGLFGGLIGEGVGEHTAFIHGATIYLAP